MVKVVAINGSARMEAGSTALVLEHFLQGMQETSASVELYYASKLEIKPCPGEFYCWNEEPGRCFIEDDMQMLYPKLRQAEVLIFATPVYIPLPGEMQNLINRLCPLIKPILEFRDGRTRARFYSNVHIKKIILVATCGWWEMGNFKALIPIFENLAEDGSVEFAGAVLRPHASLMRKEGPKVDEVKEALRRSGKELAENGTLSSELLETIRQPLISEEEYRRDLNEDYLERK